MDPSSFVGLAQGRRGTGAVHTDEVVLRMTLRTLEEAEVFSRVLTRFLETCVTAVDRLVSPTEAPFVMVTSEPIGALDVRTLTFVEPAMAQAFASAWNGAREGGTWAVAEV
jgi:hypothetical protein